MKTFGRVQFELHEIRSAAQEPCDPLLPIHNEVRLDDGGLVVSEDKPTWIGFDDDTHAVVRVGDARAAEFGVQAIQRKLSRELALVPVRPGVLVNSIPALGLTLVGTRDSISSGPGRLLFVTQRIQPHVGPPTDDMVSDRMKCPFCKLTVTPDTVVVSCRCGAIYHLETEATHPQLAPEDRLACQAKISVCLACGQPVSLEEVLAWDPATL